MVLLYRVDITVVEVLNGLQMDIIILEPEEEQLILQLHLDFYLLLIVREMKF